MLQVRSDLCLGCGICAQSCPRSAILVLWGQAEIDQSRCNSCGLCLDLCPQGAIVEVVPVSREELKDTISSLKRQADDLLARIDRLRR
jgi:formate hydrogenlyase subunit 6/NADH:ubiquinone oxidoreductase subunit I